MQPLRLRLRLAGDARTLARSTGPVLSARTLNYRTGQPHPGGLFDPALVGEGRAARLTSAHIELPLPCAHPLYLRDIAHLLDWPERHLRQVLAGQASADPGQPLDLAHSTGEAVWTALGAVQTPRSRRGRQVQAALTGQGLRPTDLMLRALPVHPAGLRPLVAWRGRLASSDLTDLYRRVIHAADRLEKLRAGELPDLVLRAACGQVQDAVDAALLHLAAQLGGKTGRLRRTALGKRVDFSGRAVITPDPSLTLDQVALPEAMARTLFTPHLIAALRREGVPFRVIRATLADPRPLDPDTRATLETLMAAATVLVNRAPTLHRPSLLAFTPVLSPGLTLGLHPLACEGMNADFDGDTVAVHLVLGAAAQCEARERMTLRANLRSSATGQLAVKPSKDMVLGLYQLTQAVSSRSPLPAFCSPDEAALAVATGAADWTDDALVMLGGERVRATPGQAQVWQTVTALTGDPALYRPQPLTKGALTTLVTQTLERCGPDTTVRLLDALKTLGLTHATVAGLSIGISDVLELPERDEWLALGQAQVQALDAPVAAGRMTEAERDRATLQIWTDLKEALGAETLAWFEAKAHNPLTVLLASGARGSGAQLTQLAAMRGLMARPDGSTVLHPVLSSFRRGLTPLEYFLSSHGARKGAADTALRTAHAGYLTRRLVLTLQHWRVAPGDCGDTLGVPEEPPSPGRVRLPGGRVRSPLTCRLITGTCAACYGADLGSADLRAAPAGHPAGLLAAQSLGEPGTQLTMRTFHTGGVAQAADMTHGLLAVTRLLDTPHPVPADLARHLHGAYAAQGVTLHPVHTEVVARAVALRGLRHTPAGPGFLAQAALGHTAQTLAQAALHAQTDPGTTLSAQTLTVGVATWLETARRLDGPDQATPEPGWPGDWTGEGLARRTSAPGRCGHDGRFDHDGFGNDHPAEPDHHGAPVAQNPAPGTPGDPAVGTQRSGLGLDQQPGGRDDRHPAGHGRGG